MYLSYIIRKLVGMCRCTHHGEDMIIKGIDDNKSPFIGLFLSSIILTQFLNYFFITKYLLQL